MYLRTYIRLFKNTTLFVIFAICLLICLFGSFQCTREKRLFYKNQGLAFLTNVSRHLFQFTSKEHHQLDQEYERNELINQTETSTLSISHINEKQIKQREAIDLILFSSWGYKHREAHIRKSLHLNWMKWYPVITPVLFSDNDKVGEEAKRHDWVVQNFTETSCKRYDNNKLFHLPTLRGMFGKVMTEYGRQARLFGLSNGDILFDDSLYATISALLQSEREIIRTRPVLILIKRINVEIDTGVVTNFTHLQQLAKQGNFPDDGSSDVFITNNLFPWNEVPELVIGRIGFGMWISAFAHAIKAVTYDVTNTVTAIHLKDPLFGTSESRHVLFSYCNLELMKSHPPLSNYHCGLIGCSRKFSQYNNISQIVFKHIGPKHWHNYCEKCF